MKFKKEKNKNSHKITLNTKSLKLNRTPVKIGRKQGRKMNMNTLFISMFSYRKYLVDNNLVMIKDKYMKKIQMTLITALTFVMMCSASWAATYYIDGTNGNDTNSGSQSAPWKTIGKANSTLKAGDTVYIKKGTYKETIRPSGSGTKGSYITYAQNGKDEVVINGVSGSGANLENRSYIMIDGIKFLNIGQHWVDMYPNSSHNIIKNCHMEEAGAYDGIWIREGSNYNKILNNKLIGKCGPKNLIDIWAGSHNLIDGNEFYGGPHDAIYLRDLPDGSSNYNIIRNNYIQNKWHSNLDNAAADYILIENNVIVDAGEDTANNMCGSSRDQSSPKEEKKGLQLMAQYSIVRNNILVNNGYGIGLASGSYSTEKPWKNDCIDNRIYHNTISKNVVGIRHNNSKSSSTDNIIKNNILYNDRDYSIKVPSVDKNYFINNNITGAEVRYSPLDIRKDNLSINPLFVDEKNRDFRLQENSKMIDKGAFLTKTENSGSGKTIKLEDARYFMDGWGIIEGDLIQLEGQTQTARITSVDYKTNTITVDASLSWTKGKGVSLPYQGSAPDIGAFEFEKKNSGLIAPSSLRVSFVE